MNVPIRMIGIATTIFWIFIIVFAVSALYSVKDVRFDFGDPQMSMTSDNELVFSLPVTIVNKGQYNLGSFNATTRIFDLEGHRIARGTTFLPVIERGRAIVTSHNVTINISNLLQRHSGFLFNDTEMRAEEFVSLSVAEVIPVQASMNQSVPWGAPLYGFGLRTPEYSFYNATHMLARVPLGFENHALFDLTGAVRIRMYNERNVEIGEGQTSIYTPHHSAYNGVVDICVSASEITPGGRFGVSFATPLFSYGPMVVSYG